MEENTLIECSRVVLFDSDAERNDFKGFINILE
jgi:hypothetical protein